MTASTMTSTPRCRQAEQQAGDQTRSARHDKECDPDVVVEEINVLRAPPGAGMTAFGLPIYITTPPPS